MPRARNALLPWRCRPLFHRKHGTYTWPSGVLDELLRCGCIWRSDDMSFRKTVYLAKPVTHHLLLPKAIAFFLNWHLWSFWPSKLDGVLSPHMHGPSLVLFMSLLVVEISPLKAYSVSTHSRDDIFYFLAIRGFLANCILQGHFELSVSYSFPRVRLMNWTVNACWHTSVSSQIKMSGARIHSIWFITADAKWI